MSEKRFSLHAAVYLVLIRDEKVLLSRRFNTGWMDGKYSLVSGHIDGGETVSQAMAREAKEEAGIKVLPRHLKMIHVMHRTDGIKEYIDFFFTAFEFQGEPRLMEPEKSDAMEWFPLHKLPKNTLSYVSKVIRQLSEGHIFSEVGW